MTIYTIPPSAPFFDTLAEFLMAGHGDPFALARTTIFLPTRRACQGLERVLLAKSGRQAIILPKIIPVRDVAEDSATMIEETSDIAPSPLNAITPLQRLLIFSRMVLEWKTSVVADSALTERLWPGNGVDSFFERISHAECVALAQDLARTLDQMTLEEIPATALKDAVPQEFFSSSELNLAFLNIIMQVWPEYLQEQNAIDPIAAWDAAIRGVAGQVRAGQFGRVIAAGSTGSTPATAELLLAIAGSAEGTLILPGLDVHMSDAAWQCVGAPGQAETHPQIHMKRILSALKIRHPRDVPILGEDAANIIRDEIFSQALLPADTTDAWGQWRSGQSDEVINAAMREITLIEAANEEEEAGVIASLLREVAASPDKTAALITPNRVLTRRVSAQLRQWGLDVPDTGGIPLADTQPGRLARALLNVLAGPDNPHHALEVMRHPAAKLKDAAILERALFRGTAFAAPVREWPQKLAAHFELWQQHSQNQGRDIKFYPPHAWNALTLRDWQLARNMLEAYIDAIQPWLELLTSGRDLLPVSACIAAFQRVFMALAAVPGIGRDAEILGVMEHFLTAAQEGGAQAFHIPPYAFPAVFETMLNAAPPVPPNHQNARILLMGAIEARLQNFDCVILAGMNEGTWPPSPAPDAWLGRPMRAALHMPMPERRIALSAHDFAQFSGQKHVFITRALREGGAPTLPSRFLQRLAAVLGSASYSQLQARGGHYVHAVRSSRSVSGRIRISEPQPRPAVDLRPRRLSVTRIDQLIHNPYAIYAEYILHIKPFEQVQAVPDQRQRGNIIHALCDMLARRWDDESARQPGWLFAELELQTRHLPQKEQLFWRIQGELIIPALIEFERYRRPLTTDMVTEQSGAFCLQLGDEVFTITGRADRIEVRDEGLLIADLKTGVPPSAKMVMAGIHTQLALLASMAKAGGFGERFAHIPLFSAEYLSFDKGAMVKSQAPMGTADKFNDTVEHITASVRNLLALYLTPAMPYRVQPYRGYIHTYPDYDHLARLGEWGIAGDEEAGDE